MKHLTFSWDFFRSYYRKLLLVPLLAAGLFFASGMAQERGGRQGGERGATRGGGGGGERGGGQRVESGRRGPDGGDNRAVLHNENNINRGDRAIRPQSAPRVNRVENINRGPVNNRPVYNNRVVNNRTVYNNSYRRPVVYDRGNPNWRYANLPRRNSIRTVFPVGYRTINYGGFGYRYYHGLFYRPYNNAFMLVPPPIGIFVDILPVGYRTIYVNNYPYYYYNGTYYDRHDDQYSVVSPPVGAVVESLPDGYETVTIDGETYYTADGAQYKPVVQDNGEIWYQVVKAN